MKNLILATSLCLSLVSYGQKINCDRFRNGKFIIEDSKVGNSIIERKGSKQIEYGEFSRTVLQYKVKWINDCTYTLRLNKILKNPKSFNIPTGMILTVEIIETKENSYTIRCSSDLYDSVLECEMRKVD